MSNKIVIEFDPDGEEYSLIHRMRNFGEDLYRACREDGWATISLDDIDSATSRLVVEVRVARRVRRVAAMIARLLAQHHFTGKARLTHVRDMK